MDTRTWWRSPIALICLAVISCSDAGTDPQSALAPQFSGNSETGPHGSDDRLDLTNVARFNSRPAPPNPQSDHALIGPAGGTLRVGDFELIVPPGAVDRPTNFRIRIPDGPQTGDYVFAEFSPHRTFNLPLTIRLPSAGTDAGETAVVGWWSGTSWVPLPTSLTPDGRIETQVGHFSYYSCFKGTTLAGG